MGENLAPGIEDMRGDIADEPAMEALVRRVKPTAIVNFAAESHVDRSIVGDLAFWHSNVLGARVLALEALKHGLRLVHVSTDEVYGDARSEEHTSESSHSQISYAVFCLKKKKTILVYMRIIIIS